MYFFTFVQPTYLYLPTYLYIIYLPIHPLTNLSLVIM
jgi:hypothetical protein